jgi:hypothetical protein
MENTLGARVRELIEAGKGETIHGATALCLITLESQTRLALGADLRWIAFPPEGREPFIYGPGSEHVLCEAVEWKRDDFEAKLEEGARAHGLPPDEVVFAFPAVGMVRAVLAKAWPYLTRLALLWLRPTELRELRADILAVARTPNMPTPIKDLAERLVVPE